MRVILLVLAALPAVAQTQNVRITWIGQACFVIQTVETGFTVVTDPPAANIGYPLPDINADAVTVTHNHGDHNNVAGLRGSPVLVDGRPVTARQEMDAGNVHFILIPGFHDNQQGAQRGQNTLIQWTQAGIRFAHLGDLGQEDLTDAQLADLRDIDVLFVPAGGFFTIEPPRAAAYVNQLKPRVAVLMHFRTALGGPAQLAGFPAAADPFPELRFKPSSLVLNRTTLPARTETWLMEVAADAKVTNAANVVEGMPVAPGSLASLWGNFANLAQSTASGFPWPKQLGTAEVQVGSTSAPLLFASSKQINFEIPSTLAPGQAAVELKVNGERAARGSVTVVSRAPGLFGVLNQDGSPNTVARPAQRGQVLQIFGTGQGEVKPVVEDGVLAPSSPLSMTPDFPSVFLNGRLIPAQFSGLAPGFSGVWQINAAIPADAPTESLSLVVIHGLVSNELTVTVR